MKLIITESQFTKLINESNLPDKTISLPNDPYDYKRENGKYYTKKKSSQTWIDVTGKNYETPIREKIFKDLKVDNKNIEKKKVEKDVKVDTQKNKQKNHQE